MSFGVARRRNNGRNPGPQQPVIKPINDTTNHVISPSVTTTTIGKDLLLKSGNGTLQDGKIVLQVNGTDSVKVSDKKIKINVPIDLGGHVHTIKITGQDDRDAIIIKDLSATCNIVCGLQAERIKFNIFVPDLAEEHKIYHSITCEQLIHCQITKKTLIDDSSPGTKGMLIEFTLFLLKDLLALPREHALTEWPDIILDYSIFL